MSRQLYSAQIAAFAGSAGLVCGMLYGTQVTVCPYPQLALGAHVQFMQAGLIGLAAGAILGNTSLCQLNEKSMFLSCVDWAHYLLLAPSLAEAYSAFQGKGMPLLAERYDASWASSDQIFLGLHYGPGVILLLGWMAIAYGIVKARRAATKSAGKTL